MRKTLTLTLALATAAAAFAVPAAAQSADGKIEVKVLGTAVLVNGRITKVKNDPLGLTTGAQTDVNNNVVPTVAIEYYATKNVSVETICCFTEHHAVGRGSLAGAQLINNILILPATVTLKYHLDAGPIKPYVGIGPSVFFFLKDDPGATASSLGVNGVKLDNHFGVAFQAGVDIPVNARGVGISVDAKKYLMKTTAHFTVDGVEALATEHKLDPWVLSGGVYFRF